MGAEIEINSLEEMCDLMCNNQLPKRSKPKTDRQARRKITDEEKKQKKKEYDHKRYLRKREEILNQCQLYHQSHLDSRRKHNREYNKNHKERLKKYNHNLNQEKNAPYHKIMDEAGIKRRCESCGTTENLCTHHKDLNHNNNELSNLQWLCLSCHAKLHQNIEREKRNAKYEIPV